MEDLDNTLTDWRSCRPDGVVIQAASLPLVLDRATARVKSSRAAGPARRDAYTFLPSGWSGSGPPLFVRMLRVDGGNPSEQIHFLRFWQAMEEVSRRLGR